MRLENTATPHSGSPHVVGKCFRVLWIAEGQSKTPFMITAADRPAALAIVNELNSISFQQYEGRFVYVLSNLEM